MFNSHHAFVVDVQLSSPCGNHPPEGELNGLNYIQKRY